MDSNALTQLLYCFCTLSALLLAGTLLRAKVPVFRKLFLPASVIGGFLGLLLGPVIWGSRAPLPFPTEWVSTWAELPGVLIVPVVACVPLGMKVRGKNEPKTKKGKTSANVLKTFGIIGCVTALQGSLGLFIQFIFNTFFGANLYEAFGYELPSGFSGGHGTAGIIGNFFKNLNLEYWEISQGVTTTMATFGLIGGMIIGIIYINVAARKGKTALLSKPGDIPPHVAKGYQMDKNQQDSLGKETTINSSIESLTFHLAIVLSGCGLAYGVIYIINVLGIPGLGSIPIWAYAILVMFAVNFFLHKIGLGPLIDAKTKSRISGTCSDFAITAAIASMPVQAILQYIVPILVVVFIGYIVTFCAIRFLSNRFFNDFKVERSMACFGTCSGVFLTGMMLLKLCDPNYESPVLNDYTVGFSLNSITSFLLMTFFINMLIAHSTMFNVLLQFAFAVLFFLIIVIVNRTIGTKASTTSKA